MKRSIGPDADIAFNLKFDKAREKTRDNREDFAPVRVTLQHDAWNVEADERRRSGKMPSPMAQKFHDALLDAIVAAPRLIYGRSAATKDAWVAECVRLGLLDHADERTSSSSRALLSKYRRELIEANWIGCDGDLIWSIRQQR